MQLTSSDIHLLPPWASMPLWGKSGLVRSNGVHVTEILYNIYRKVLDPKGESRGGTDEVQPDTDDKWGQFEKGFLWEVGNELALRTRHHIRPEEIEMDRVCLSPDEVEVREDGLFQVVEYKCTSSSAASDPSSKWMWIHQAKCYCHAVGTPFAEFRVAHLSGDYKTVRGMCWRQHWIKFDPEEITACWNMVLAEKERMGR